MNKTIIISEEKEQQIIGDILTEVFCPSSEKVLIIKDYIDKNFARQLLDNIDDDGYPTKEKTVVMLSADKQPLKTLNMKEFLRLLDDRFIKMISDEKDRKKFLKQVIKDWYYNKIDKNGLLSVNILTEVKDDNTMKDWIDSTIKDANDFLSDFGLSVTFNAKYDFNRNSYYQECFAIYQNGSVKNNGRIRIGLNIPKIQSEFNRNKLQYQVELSIWHEIGHGIVEYLKGLRRKDTQCGTKIFKGKMLKDFRAIISDEEYYVEEFGDYMSPNGYALFSSLSDFLELYSNEILTLRNQEGGSKWLQTFKTEQ